jgi:hypothetical protein
MRTRLNHLCTCSRVGSLLSQTQRAPRHMLLSSVNSGAAHKNRHITDHLNKACLPGLMCQGLGLQQNGIESGGTFKG